MENDQEVREGSNISEDELCRVLADKLRDSSEFGAWFLTHTKFEHLARNVKVLFEEQRKNRFSAKAPWWRHWFTSKCLCTGCFGGRETDIFVVFEAIETKARFSLHIENKTLNSRFTVGQAEAYAVRAKCWAGQKRFLNYTDFATVLIAPKAFRERNPNTDFFDSFISYEELAKVLPEYAL
jgi:hypothetical protein